MSSPMQVIGQYCQNKDTMSLKTLCSHLARKPSSLDIILLFEKSTAILQPLCEYLDGWRYDEDQGEYQPVYEEFGCILLLVLAFVYRYDLSTVDLGLHANDSFVAKLLVRGALSKSMDELSEQERGHLDGWIRGLFNAEGGGLGDETMSACPPQEFYLLVPTLFSQIVLACSTGHLNDEGLKGGLECKLYICHSFCQILTTIDLVDTFLLPSLVGAITWLAHHLWESRGDSNAVIQILQTLIKPGSISNEASLMLASILDIVAKPLEHSLRSLQRSEPSRQDVEPLSKALKPHLSFSRTGGSDHTELESWTGQHGGGLASSIRHTIQSMVQWSLTPGTNITPTSYTHRQILVGVRMIGARRVLQAILEEIKAQAEAGNGSVVLDAAVAIICAPDARSPMPTALLTMLDEPSAAPQPLQRRLNLRDTLKTEAENAAKIHKTDVIQAEMIIRLYRRVEAQMTVPMEIQAQQNMLQHALGGMDVGNGALDGGLEDGGIGDLNSAQLGLGAGGLMGGAQDIDGDMLSLGMGDGMMGVDGDDFADLKMEF
jgi:mediator of RNA polymerase II transcription subunit 5